MAIQTMGKRPGQWLKHEEPDRRSRKVVTILAGSGSDRVLTSGMLLQVSTGTAAGAAVAGNTGGGTITASPTVGAGAKEGRYTVKCIETASGGGRFGVFDPQGNAIGVALVGTQFVGGGLTFTVADGSPDFALGDSFTVDVSALKYVQMAAAGKAAGILFDDITAVNGTDNNDGILVHQQVTVNDTQLTWPDGIAAAHKLAEKNRLIQENLFVFNTGL